MRVHRTELSLYIVEAADLLRKGTLEGSRLGVELANRLVSAQSHHNPLRKLSEVMKASMGRHTSLKSMVPSSPSAETTSRPISLAMYSCVKDMSAERNMVSLGGAMMATQETGLPMKDAYLKRWWGVEYGVEG
jgi:hypothetical protein